MGCNFCKSQRHSLYCLLEESEKSLNYQNLSPAEITKVFQNHMGYPYVFQNTLEQILRDLRLAVPDFQSQNPLSVLYKSFVVQRKKSFNLSRNFSSSKNIKSSPSGKKLSEESNDNDIQYEFKIKNIYLMVILLSNGSPKEKSKYIYDFFINSERRPFVDKDVLRAFIKDLIQIVAIQLPILIYGQKH